MFVRIYARVCIRAFVCMYARVCIRAFVCIRVFVRVFYDNTVTSLNTIRYARFLRFLVIPPRNTMIVRVY